MTNNLSKKLGEMEYDSILADITPKTEVRGGVVRKLSAKATYKRGTILAKSSGTAGDGKLVILGTAAATNETLTPYCILCDDVEVGTEDDVTATVYTAGCFNLNKMIVANGYTLTDGDYDNLRKYSITFKAVSAN